MTMEIGCVLCGGCGLKLPGDPPVKYWSNRSNRLSPRECYQKLLNLAGADVLVMFHDDVTVHDAGWEGVMTELFDSKPEVVAAGFGGGTSLGHPDLGKVPWSLGLMARGGYGSNQTDAEVHGERIVHARRVAVLDQFCMAIRVEWLRARGGWPSALTHHCLDLWLACEAARWGGEIWTIPASVIHHGGGSSTGESYARAPWLLGGSVARDHQLAHEWIRDEFADVLPVRVEEDER